MMNAVQDNTIVFNINSDEVLRFEENGKIYIHGELVDDNQKVYTAMLDFLTNTSTLEVSTEFDNV